MGNFHLFILSSLKDQKKYFKPDNRQKKGKKKKEITHFDYKQSNSLLFDMYGKS